MKRWRLLAACALICPAHVFAALAIGPMPAIEIGKPATFTWSGGVPTYAIRLYVNGAKGKYEKGITDTSYTYTFAAGAAKKGDEIIFQVYDTGGTDMKSDPVAIGGGSGTATGQTTVGGNGGGSKTSAENQGTTTLTRTTTAQTPTSSAGSGNSKTGGGEEGSATEGGSSSSSSGSATGLLSTGSSSGGPSGSSSASDSSSASQSSSESGSSESASNSNSADATASADNSNNVSVSSSATDSSSSSSSTSTSSTGLGGLSHNTQLALGVGAISHCALPAGWPCAGHWGSSSTSSSQDAGAASSTTTSTSNVASNAPSRSSSEKGRGTSADASSSTEWTSSSPAATERTSSSPASSITTTFSKNRKTRIVARARAHAYRTSYEDDGQWIPSTTATSIDSSANSVHSSKSTVVKSIGSEQLTTLTSAMLSSSIISLTGSQPTLSQSSGSSPSTTTSISTFSLPVTQTIGANPEVSDIWQTESPAQSSSIAPTSTSTTIWWTPDPTSSTVWWTADPTSTTSWWTPDSTPTTTWWTPDPTSTTIWWTPEPATTIGTLQPTTSQDQPVPTTPTSTAQAQPHPWDSGTTTFNPWATTSWSSFFLTTTSLPTTSDVISTALTSDPVIPSSTLVISQITSTQTTITTSPVSSMQVTATSGDSAKDSSITISLATTSPSQGDTAADSPTSTPLVTSTGTSTLTARVATKTTSFVEDGSTIVQTLLPTISNIKSKSASDSEGTVSSADSASSRNGLHSDSKHNALNKAAIIGGVVGAVILFSIISSLLWWCHKRRRDRAAGRYEVVDERSGLQQQRAAAVEPERRAYYASYRGDLEGTDRTDYRPSSDVSFGNTQYEREPMMASVAGAQPVSRPSYSRLSLEGDDNDNWNDTPRSLQNQYPSHRVGLPPPTVLTMPTLSPSVASSVVSLSPSNVSSHVPILMPARSPAVRTPPPFQGSSTLQHVPSIAVTTTSNRLEKLFEPTTVEVEHSHSPVAGPSNVIWRGSGAPTTSENTSSSSDAEPWDKRHSENANPFEDPEGEGETSPLVLPDTPNPPGSGKAGDRDSSGSESSGPMPRRGKESPFFGHGI
ncbi:hypothetical protein T439DRAFT_379088 [Meredithblackwellia eburnea MCA 4105]